MDGKDCGEAYALIRELIGLLEKREETDDGREFRPNRIDSCRCLDGARMDEILARLKAIAWNQRFSS